MLFRLVFLGFYPRAPFARIHSAGARQATCSSARSILGSHPVQITIQAKQGCTVDSCEQCLNNFVALILIMVKFGVIAENCHWADSQRDIPWNRDELAGDKVLCTSQIQEHEPQPAEHTSNDLSNGIFQ